MQIDKSYFTLPEILDRWQIAEADLIYLAENDELRLSVRVFGLPVVFADAEATAMRAALQVPLAQTRYDGLLDLHARDVFQLFRCGELHVSAFRTPRAGCAALLRDEASVVIRRADMLIRSEERHRFEAEVLPSLVAPAEAPIGSKALSIAAGLPSLHGHPGRLWPLSRRPRLVARGSAARWP
jgi:hypothetical protein